MTTHVGASSSSSFSSSSAPIHPWTYHVFLSFRGEDTRNTFTGHLHKNLVQKGIKTFIDNDGLPRGEEISSSLLKAIEESKISVIVFSENYASSKWCLEELVKIMQCKESKKQIVYPVFYKVDPSHVRNQTGRFGEALAHYDDLEKVARWKTALTKAGHLSGWPFSHGEHESEFICKIVEEVSQQVSNLSYLNRDIYLVGIESRLANMEKLVCVGKSDVRMIGIWGIGGLGKTTIAKAVYNSIAHKFDSSCFLENVRERSLKYGGPAKLQKSLLFKTLGLKDLKINSLDQGGSMIKEMLSQTRVLLILDDVNDLDQLRSLVGKSDWFGSGSRIIITTRDQDLLRRHDVNQIYQVEKLSHREALELFNINAFKEKQLLFHEKEDMSDHIKLIDSVIHYAEGLPLVLKVLGSYLRGRSIDEWKDALEYCKRNTVLPQFLKLSYDALEPSVKEAFLHIACFFKGENKNRVMDILEGCDLPKHSIAILIERALISITEATGIWMHDVLEEMAKEIICQESSEPGERSRLWLYEDVRRILENNTGTNKVKGIIVKKGTSDQQIPLNTESFLKLNNLQILIISDDIFCGRHHVNYLPNDLSLLEWKECPLQYFPSNFCPTRLVVLKMNFRCPSLWGVFKGAIQHKMPWICTSPVGNRLKTMPNLKSFYLEDCYAVKAFSDLPTFPNLEELTVTSGVLLTFEIVKEMKSLKRLDLSCNYIRELPSSAIGHLINLEQLTLSGSKLLQDLPRNIFELQHLQLLDLSYCEYIVTFPTNSEFSTESASLQDKHYAPLFVNLSHCENLVEIGEFPREIYGLDVNNCPELEGISRLSNILEGKDSRMIPRMNLCFSLDLYKSRKLYRNLASEVVKTKKHLPDNSDSTALFSLFFSCRQSEYQVFLHGTDIPEWFTYRWQVKKGGLLEYMYTFDFPRNFDWTDKGLAFCASSITLGAYLRVVRIYINGVSVIEAPEKRADGMQRYHAFVWMHYIPFDVIIKRLSESGLPPPTMCCIKFEFQLETHHVISVKAARVEDKTMGNGGCGVHVVMPEDEGQFVPATTSSSVVLDTTPWKYSSLGIKRLVKQ